MNDFVIANISHLDYTHTTMNNARALLGEHELKATKPRIAVLSLLHQSRHPLSIDELHEALDSKLTKATLYRVLDSLVSCGIVYQTNFRDGKAYFELQSTHHHHVVCTECGLTERVATCVAHPSQLPKSFERVTSHMLEFFGHCKKCAKL